MSDVYGAVLALEGAVVFVSGAVIVVAAARNPDVVLYSQAIALAGAGLAAGGLATALGGVGVHAPVSALVVVAGVAFVAAGWRLAVDRIGEADEVYVTGSGDSASGGFDGQL